MISVPFQNNYDHGMGPVEDGFRIGHQPLSFSAEAATTVERPENVRNPGLILGFEFSWIFRGHQRDE